MADLTWNNPLNTPASYSSTDTLTENSKLVRLVEDSEIVKHIEFDELSIIYTEIDSATGSQIDQSTLPGVLYPVIRINDTIFSETEIQQVNISSDGFLPTIDICIKMNNEMFIEKDMPKDGDIISTFVRSNTSALNYLRNDFIITSCNTNITLKSTTILVSGKLFIPGLDAKYNRYAFIGSSKTVLKNIAKKFNIGFSTNDFDDTNDFQNWICTGNNYTFIKDITMHSWKNNTSFYKTWIDLYYDLCFVNVNKFLLSDQNTEDEIDITFQSMTAQYQTLLPQRNDTDNVKLSMKLFTTFKGFRGSPFYIKKWYQINNSAEVSFKHGYSIESLVYRHNPNLFAKSDASCFETLTNIPAYDQTKLDTHIILRGRAAYDKNTNPQDEEARVNYDLAQEYINKEWKGIEYLLNDDDSSENSNNDWSGNVHKNYNRALSHNEINLAELEKMYITIECDGLCLQVMRGERIPVVITYDILSTRGTVLPNDQHEDNINRMYSGFYIVDSITYSYNLKMKDSNVHSRYTTTLVLKRREWPTPEKIQIDNTNDNSGEIVADTKKI
jgi:hypothetical protein